MESSNWAPAHSDALRRYFAMGMSFAEIARAINKEFKTHYSRCAAIGRARRLGLGFGRLLEELALAAPVVAKAESSNFYKMVKSQEALAKWLARLAHRKEMPKLRCAAVEPRCVPLLELEAGDCRYPYGGEAEGEAITFCGHPKRWGSSYCAAHFHLTRNQDAAPQRAVVAAALRVVEAPSTSRFRRYPISQFQGDH
jgi:GcrA cell cycle regulator